MSMVRLKAAWEVHAGIIPGQPIPEHSKRFTYTEEDRAADELLPPMPEGHKIDIGGEFAQPHISRFTARHMEAMQYYSGLCHPQYLNWATITWIWY